MLKFFSSEMRKVFSAKRHVHMPEGLDKCLVPAAKAYTFLQRCIGDALAPMWALTLHVTNRDIKMTRLTTTCECHQSFRIASPRGVV